MYKNNRYPKIYLSHIAIIGGGRWARVLVETICSIVTKTTLISIYSPNNANKMSLWVMQKKFVQDIRVHNNILSLKNYKIDAAIVVNAARDHAFVIEKIIQQEIPLLVEKPVTLSYDETKRLVLLAEKSNVLFSASHVFLFTSYLKNFFDIVTKSGKINYINVHWTDPKLEKRQGQFKKYDQGLPVIHDWLPHILSIIINLTGKISINDMNIIFKKGGADVEIKFMLENIFCNIKLARNDNIRRRILEIDTKKKLRLDFSQEPGTIYNGYCTRCSDEKWGFKKSPLTLMLLAFLIQTTSKKIDKRLDINLGLHTNKIIDRVASLYNKALLDWLQTRLVSSDKSDTDLEYALKEIIFFKGYFSGNFENCIENIKQTFNSENSNKWIKKISKSSKPFNIIRSIAFSKHY